ncbi:putative 3-demethylubiquinone-9 3-methyltransferase (glyoxalase superfamily) [Chitinophaga skermanii]|uniref:Putative 3-demethylubiquinone-9 3-methyltransferase (Glyoxalase superfamily) n=1 Tax=Chitinophaga skermanii TaxID=331697 RepID=A0A327QYW2_9BACT|nr:VOC family protein [Chitinophaga skermanii]RAJ08812.1 putative 3-demethylubiquinone-9 3-methyltransferase (glyoxalase superfamily) [Chitinophaga skermanii]
MQTITPFLWFNGQAEEAVNFYVSTFRSASVKEVQQMGGAFFYAEFTLQGQNFIALNADGTFKFNPAISFMVELDTQEEVDEYWDKLTANGGKESQCGWLEDKFGLSWQIVPRTLTKLMRDPNKQKANAVMQAMMKMKKIIIKDLEDAYNQA